MPHLILTSVLVIALLAIVATAIGACFGIARDLMLDGADDDGDEQSALGGNGRISLSEEFGVGLRHAATFAQARGGSLHEGRPRDA
jgi:hypothetical protein